jgi:hypothetical protein
MKKVYIRNIEAANEMIKAAEGRATARTASAEALLAAFDQLRIERLNGISSKALKGSKAIYHASSERLPRSYKYQADSTQIALEHDGKDWFIVDVSRKTLRQTAKLRLGIELTLSDTAKEWLLNDLDCN